MANEQPMSDDEKLTTLRGMLNREVWKREAAEAEVSRLRAPQPSPWPLGVSAEQHIEGLKARIRELTDDNNRLRAALATAEQRATEAREIVQAVAESTIVCNNYFDDGLPHAPAHVDDLCPRHPVKASTLRAQARAWLASSSSEAADARAASSAK